MSMTFDERLNEILPRITDPRFLSSEGIGNEIAFYIFDYSAQEELKVRDHLAWMLDRIASHHQKLKVLHLNLFDVILAYLNKRGLFEKALKMETAKGDAELIKSLRGPVKAEKICEFIDGEYKPVEYDLLLLSGVGSMWPMLRAHSLLNCLAKVMGQTPLVMFYPGRFDGTALRLFDRIAPVATKPGAKPYYRAFELIPREAKS